MKLAVFTKLATGPHSFSVKPTASGPVWHPDVLVCWAVLEDVFRSLDAGTTSQSVTSLERRGVTADGIGLSSAWRGSPAVFGPGI